MEDAVMTYLSTLLGERIAVRDLPVSDRKRVGWIVNFYTLKEVSLRGQRYVLAFARAGQRYTPVAVAKQLARGREALSVPMVYVPRELGPHDIPRLIAANVPYVLAGRSLFLPDLGLSVSRPPQTPVVRESFSVPAQLLVLGYIIKKWNGEMTISDGMRRTSFSLASIVHAFQEIEYFGAGDRVRGDDGRTMRIRLRPAREIWENCPSRFINPCKRTVGVLAQPEGAVPAGVDALARISALNEDAVPSCFALPVKGFRARGIEELSSESVSCRLQLWLYPPTVLGGDSIDPASLFLSLRDEPDDRVQIELDKLQEAFKW